MTITDYFETQVCLGYSITYATRKRNVKFRLFMILAGVSLAWFKISQVLKKLLKNGPLNKITGLIGLIY